MPGAPPHTAACQKNLGQAFSTPSPGPCFHGAEQGLVAQDTPGLLSHNHVPFSTPPFLCFLQAWDVKRLMEPLGNDSGLEDSKGNHECSE